MVRAIVGFHAHSIASVMNVQKVRWHGCVTRINSLMPMATSSIYVKHHFDHEAKKQHLAVLRYVAVACPKVQAILKMDDDVAWNVEEASKLINTTIETGKIHCD
ncbi:hypothetical protein ANCCEY_15585, partial [Ancylostoma ceylanicum]